MTLEYDPEAHTYKVSGRRVLSNTDVLSLGGLCNYSMVPNETREAALAVGKAVHAATLLYDKGGGKWKRYIAFEGYVQAYDAFCREFKIKWRYREVPFHDSLLGYCTTPDGFGESRYGPITAQLKTGPVEDWVGIQLAAEERAVFANSSEHALADRLHNSIGISTDRRFAVELRADGTYKPRQFTEETDIRVFTAALTTVNWKIRKGMIKWP